MPETPPSIDLPCRVLPHRVADGPSNMALDEALLDSVDRDPSAAVVRTYEWSVPTLSLGYFGEFAEAEADPRWRDVPIVRRPTGGGALWHDREITYAVVIPGSHPASRPSSALYRAIHSAIAAELRALGLDARRLGDLGPVDPSDPRRFLCFADRDAEDIVAQGSKLVGSAQRRRRGSGAVLQHGSLLLARSATTPELPGLAEVGPAGAADRAWPAILAGALPRRLGLAATADAVRPGEAEAARRLGLERYGRSSWTRRR